jgi:hypothetical protein
MGRACGTYGLKRNACRALAENLKVRGHLEDLGIDEKVILKYILKK